MRQPDEPAAASEFVHCAAKTVCYNCFHPKWRRKCLGPGGTAATARAITAARKNDVKVRVAKLSEDGKLSEEDKMSEEDKWKTHLDNDRRDYRGDCLICLAGAAKARQHRRTTPKGAGSSDPQRLYQMTGDYAGPFKAGTTMGVR